MSSKKDNNDIWSISYNFTQSYDPLRAYRRHEVEKEMALLRDIEMWVDICGDDLPEAKAILKKIMEK